MIQSQRWDVQWWARSVPRTVPYWLTSPKATLPVDVKLAKVGPIYTSFDKALRYSPVDDDSGGHIPLSGTYAHSGGLSLIQATLPEPDG